MLVNITLTLGIKKGSAEKTNNHSSKKWKRRERRSSPSAVTISVVNGVTVSISVMYPNIATAALRRYCEGRDII